jgi:site-specific recombinase XerD
LEVGRKHEQVEGTLRHTFASNLVMRGVPLKAVQELMRHATIEMTMPLRPP